MASQRKSKPEPNQNQTNPHWVQQCPNHQNQLINILHLRPTQAQAVDLALVDILTKMQEMMQQP